MPVGGLTDTQTPTQVVTASSGIPAPSLRSFLSPTEVSAPPSASSPVGTAAFGAEQMSSSPALPYTSPRSSNQTIRPHTTSLSQFAHATVPAPPEHAAPQLSDGERTELSAYKPMKLSRLRDLRECGMGTVLSILRGLASRQGGGTNYIILGKNLRVRQEIRTSLVSPATINDNILACARSGQPFSILTTLDEFPDIWYGHRGGFRILLNLIRGSGQGYMCKSTFAVGGIAHVVFLLDFPCDSLAVDRTVQFEERRYSDEQRRAERASRTRLQEIYGSSSEGFIDSVLHIRRMSVEGVPVDVAPAATTETEFGGITPAKLNIQQVYNVSKEVFWELLQDPQTLRHRDRVMIFNGHETVRLEVRCVGHKSEEEATEVRRQWTGAEDSTVVDFPPALASTPEAQLDYAESDPLFGSYLHKNVATLLTLLLTPTQSLHAISYGVFLHSGGRTRVLTYLQSFNTFRIAPERLKWTLDALRSMNDIFVQRFEIQIKPTADTIVYPRCIGDFFEKKLYERGKKKEKE